MKTFVLDTSVLIHDPEAIFHFQENTVAIPVEVLQELDRIKTESSERGQSARAVQRKLLGVLPQNIEKPATLPNGGSIQLVLPPPTVTEKGNGELKKVVGDMSAPDHRILAAAQWLAKNGGTTILVTKDLGMMLKGRALGLQTEDYLHDKSTITDEVQTTKIEIGTNAIQRFLSEGWIEMEEREIPQLPLNSYGLFLGEKKIPWRYGGAGRFFKLQSNEIQVPNGRRLKARNLEQAFLIDALLQRDIHLITAAGRAGTGKTLVTVAASLYLIGKREFTGLCISKPNESIGKENGFLPGTLEEKMRPWLQPYADALNLLHQSNPPQNRKQSQRKQENQPPQKRPYDQMTESGLVEITAIEYIRGRSIPNRIFILDECQNVAPRTIKTIASRMAEGSKLICLGDLEQIDNPYLDTFSNGLAHIRDKMRDLPNAAHITLHKGERSLLAEQAASLL